MRAPYLHIAVLFSFLVNGLGPVPMAQADFLLPQPGVMVHLSPPMNPPMLKGLKVHPNDPLTFDFILDRGDGPFSKTESSQLIKYFLSGLTIPENDLWVNLSPYEKNRIIPKSFGLTGMGRDLLAEDYILKQITASLIYPEDPIGKKFWNRVYQEAARKFGTTNLPVSTFNKVWIVPDKAIVYENDKTATAYIIESKLKVMLEQDYLSLANHLKGTGPLKGGDLSPIIREIVIPELTKEVNEGENFAKLRQVYNSLILADWYKKKIKDSILEEVYANKAKLGGISIDDPKETQRIYTRYLRAFKKGVYNYIKEEVDPATQQMVPRKYFSGGTSFNEEEISEAESYTTDAAAVAPNPRLEIEKVQLKTIASDFAMIDGANIRILSKMKGELIDVAIRQIESIISRIDSDFYNPKPKDIDLMRRSLEGENPSEKFALAVYNKRIIGYVFFNTSELHADTFYVSNLAVDPRVGGMGVGRLLMDSVFEYAADNGFEYISLDTSSHPENRATQFYEELEINSEYPISIIDRYRHGGLTLITYKLLDFAQTAKKKLDNNVNAAMNGNEDIVKKGLSGLLQQPSFLSDLERVNFAGDDGTSLDERLSWLALTDHIEVAFTKQESEKQRIRENDRYLDFYQIGTGLDAIYRFLLPDDITIEETFKFIREIRNLPLGDKEKMLSWHGEKFKQAAILMAQRYRDQMSTHLENIIRIYFALGMAWGGEGATDLEIPELSEIAHQRFDESRRTELIQWLGVDGEVSTTMLLQKAIELAVRGTRLELDRSTYWRGMALFKEGLDAQHRRSGLEKLLGRFGLKVTNPKVRRVLSFLEKKSNAEMLRHKIIQAQERDRRLGGAYANQAEAEIEAIRAILEPILRLPGWVEGRRATDESSPTQARLTNTINCVARSALTAMYLEELGIKVWSVEEMDHILLLVRLSDGSYYWVEPSAPVIITKEQIENKQVGLKWMDVSEKLINNGWATVTGTGTDRVILTADLTREKTRMITVFGEEVYKQKLEPLFTKLQAQSREKSVRRVIHPMPNDSRFDRGYGLDLRGELDQDFVYINNWHRGALGCFLSNFGNDLADQGYIQDAEEAIRKAIEVNPTDPVYRFNLGLILAKEEKYLDAEREIRNALTVISNNSNIHSSLGDVLSLQGVGRYEEAEAEYRQAIALDRRNLTVYFGLARILKSQRRFQEAVEVYQRAITLEPEKVEFYNNLADTLAQMERYQEARQTVIKALELNPTYATAYFTYATILWQEGRQAQAREMFNKAVQYRPELASNVEQFLRDHAMIQRSPEEMESYLREQGLSIVPIDFQRFFVSEIEREKVMRAVRDHQVIKISNFSFPDGKSESLGYFTDPIFKSFSTIFPEDWETAYAVREQLKNAYYYGNKMHNDIPIYLLVDTDTQEVSTYNLQMGDGTAQYKRLISAGVGNEFGGFGRGSNRIVADGWQRPELNFFADHSGTPLGVRTVLRRDRAMTVRGGVLVFVASLMLSNLSFGRQDHPIPQSNVTWQTKLVSINGLIDRMFSPSTAQVLKHDQVLQEHISQAGVQHSQIIFESMIKLFGRENLEKGLKNSLEDRSHGGADLVENISQYAYSYDDDNKFFRKKVKEIFDLLATLYGQDTIKAAIVKHSSALAEMIQYDAEHNPELMDRIKVFFPAPFIEEWKKTNLGSFSFFLLDYDKHPGEVQYGQHIENVITALSSLIGKDTVMYALLHETRDVTDFSSFGNIEEQWRCMRVVVSRFGKEKVTAWARKDLGRVQKIFNSYVYDEQHQLLAQHFYQIDELFGREFLDRFSPQEMDDFLTTWRSDKSYEIMQRVQHLLGQKHFDDIAQHHLDLLMSYFDFVRRSGDSQSPIEKEPFLVDVNGIQAGKYIGLARAALEQPYHFSDAKQDEKMDFGPNAMEISRRILLVMIVLHNEYPKWSLSEYRDLIMAAQQAYFEKGLDADALFSFGPEYLGHKSYQAVMMTLAHEIGHHLFGKSAGEFIADTNAFAFAEQMGWKGSIKERMQDKDQELGYPVNVSVPLEKTELEDHVIARTELKLMSGALDANSIHPIFLWRNSLEVFFDMHRRGISLVGIENGKNAQMFKEVFVRWVLKNLDVHGQQAENLVIHFMKVKTHDIHGMIPYDDLNNLAKKIKDAVTSDNAKPVQQQGYKGGIDLTASQMNVETRNTNGAIRFHLNPAQLAQLQNARGFIPQILTMQPLKDLRAWLVSN